MGIVSRWMLTWFWVVFLVGGLMVDTTGGQSSSSSATTDPSEARALNTMFRRWGISASNQWNVSGELCSGAAVVVGTTLRDLNPGIICYRNNDTWHIAGLSVYAMDVSGPLPNELWNLTYLYVLNLGKNYLTGSIPPSIGNLYHMQYLSFGINALSGSLPSELGQLKNLISLTIGGNNFSGPFPTELGNLTELLEIFFDNSGISGVIPETFASLQNMQTVFGSNNDLIGRIPTFIGNWKNLVSLRLQGNSFRGSIPSSFSNLTALTDLRIGDVLDVTSSLDFLQNLTSLSTLILRNNFISDSLPTFFNNFQRLSLLDLSFNNLTGSIPDNIFNHISLTNLYLGNNSLTGVLPTQKSPILINIDVSYNELTGSIPSWINDRNLQLNAVANNFTLDSNSNVLPSGLKCLQRGFPCNHGSPVYSRFAIKCGGEHYRTRSNKPRISFDRDDGNLGPAMGAIQFPYQAQRGPKWAVSNAGWPVDSINPQYRISTSSDISNTQDPLIFQSSRISAGSLRYFGLGLENGNYSVTLYFAETAFNDTRARSWRSTARRIFDVYIQGNLLLRDFDIQREAGGFSNIAVVKEFNIEVLDNYIEIHLFWAGKGTCCIPEPGIYGPTISAITATPNFAPRSPRNTLMIVGVTVGVVATILVFLIAVLFVLHKKRQQNLENEDPELLGIDYHLYTFGYSELKTATDDFNVVNKLGEGGFGAVYKGTLGDGRKVAIKNLSMASSQGKKEFLAEIAAISAVQHRNLVKLYGCCNEQTSFLLVYEFLENKSLDRILFRHDSNGVFLNWAMRYNICLGVARGLAYLHEESSIRIVHRDVKASNILLDSDFTPKISDFGLAKFYDNKETHITTGVAGTLGYLAPEYAMHGHLSEKADIYSFGIVVMEIVSGRRNSEASLEDGGIHIFDRTWKLYKSNKELELVDPRLEEYDSKEVRTVIGVAMLCTQLSPTLRPPMSRVVAMLSGDIKVAPVTSHPGFIYDLDSDDPKAHLWIARAVHSTLMLPWQLIRAQVEVLPSFILSFSNSY